MNEVWKDVVHYEGLYEVSNLGRVRNKQTQKIKAQTSNYNKTTNKGGYLTVQLWKNNCSKREYVHRLVAMAFIPNPDHKPQVNHKDEIKTNNEVSNLEWVTCSENIKHAYANKLHSQTGSRNAASKLTEEQVLEIIDLLLQKKYTYAEIGAKYGVNEETIGAIKRKQNWTFLTKDIDFD